MTRRPSRGNLRREGGGDSSGDIGDDIEVHRVRMLSSDFAVGHARGRALTQRCEVVVASDEGPSLNRGAALILAVMVRGLIDGGGVLDGRERDSAA